MSEDFKSHKDLPFTAVNAYVDLDTSGGTPKADRVIIENKQLKDIKIKPRDEVEVEKKVNGLPSRDTEKQKYPVKHLPEEIKDLIFEINEADGKTYTATVGEHIESGSLFITMDNFDSIDSKQTKIFDDEEDVAEEFAEKEVNA